MIPDTPHGTWIITDVPGRLDALGWSRWHRRLILALGITWILDGLEASLVANLAPTLRHPDALGLTATAGRDRELGVPGRPGRRRAGVRPPHRPARPQAAVPRHARALPRGDRAQRPGAGLRGVPRVPAPRGRRHRRRILRDQLRDRRARAGAHPRRRSPSRSTAATGSASRSARA